MKGAGSTIKALLTLCVILLLLPAPLFAFERFDPQELHGFIDLRGGSRLQNDRYQRDTSLLEARLQLEYNQQFDSATLLLRGDLLADEVTSGKSLDLQTGAGIFDLREANLIFSPTDLTDLKIGRQILTWGTGDLLFINDMFPKDWQAFFIGRDEEYLKAPSDALLLSLFPDWATIDIAFTPQFDSDRYPSGERLSYWNPQLGRIAGRDAVNTAEQPDRWLQDYELALRLAKNLAGYELAIYGYRGFWKSPAGFNPVSGRASFPRLNSYGASLRGALQGGIGHFEFGYYDSREDRTGSDPLLPNSELRYLLGYERELAKEFTASGQFYLEQLLDYASYRQNLSGGEKPRDEFRQLLTLRLTKLLLQQTLTLSLFSYWSPSDQDFYLRPTVKYKLTDALLLTAGGNLFGGDQRQTFFGQFTDNTNIYAGIRYSF